MVKGLYNWPPGDAAAMPAAHHEIWIDALERLARGQIPNNRLLIIAPPGHAKTNYGAIAFPSWVIGNDWLEHVLVFSATAAQSRKTSLTIREAATSDMWAQLHPNAVPDLKRQWAAESWYMKRPQRPGDKDPSIYAVGIGSQSVLGARGSLLVYDDVSTQDNTRTSTRRERVRDWIALTAFSRAIPDAKHLGIMTRWHSDDIAGFFESEGFTTLVMPANGYWDMDEPAEYLADYERRQALPGPTGERQRIYAPGGDDLWYTKVNAKAASMTGTPLWGDHVKDEELEGHRRTLGDWKYGAMYQGNPTTVEGAVFREEFFGPHYTPYNTIPAVEQLLAVNRTPVPPYSGVVDCDGTPVPLVYKGMFVDSALKEGEESDYTVMATWGVGIDRQAYLLDVWRDRVDAVDLFDLFILEWRKQVPDIAVIEDRASGIQLIQDIQRKTRIPVTTVNPTTNKEERARAQVHVVRGAFCIPDPELGPEWVAAWLQEHLEFPRGSYDDQVDTTTMAAETLRHMVDFFERDSDDVFGDMPDQVGNEPTVIRPDSTAAALEWTGSDGGEFGMGAPHDGLSRPDQWG